MAYPILEKVWKASDKDKKQDCNNYGHIPINGQSTTNICTSITLKVQQQEVISTHLYNEHKDILQGLWRLASPLPTVICMKQTL